MNPNNVKIFVYTEREGVLSPVGHDLKLEVGRFTVDFEGSEVEVNVDADSLKVAACIVNGNEESVSNMDRKVIEKNLNKDVLQTHKFRHIDFRGNVTKDGEDQILRGELEILGKTHQVELRMKPQGAQYRGELVIDQREWGMKPFTAFLGALRIKPDIRIEVFADA